ncbi:uncharacterized protein IL334_007488 [Kwoniella shivajii]|uniref:C2H2-type domain-containing protein n=1 Tax=Kwoniella shivajii TaxID=564305 RepID=A0ABZ1DAY1_9TREE|nr:hypothetical protein IL334_007488 [Kwoniella shivajii]
MSPTRTSHPLVPGPGVSIAAAETPINDVLQPFQCAICQKRFTRHENLKRHYAAHVAAESGASYSCGECSTTFSRMDLRKRHMKRKHPDKTSDVAASERSLPSQDTQDQNEDQDQQRSTSTGPSPEQFLQSPNSFDDLAVSDYRTSIVHDPLKRTGGANGPSEQPSTSLVQENAINACPTLPITHLPETFTTDESTFRRNNTVQDADLVAQLLFNVPDDHTNTTSTTFTTSQSTSQGPDLSLHDIHTGVELYFDHVSQFLPFLHRPSFRAEAVSKPLLLSVLSLGYQFSDEAYIWKTLASQCFHHAVKLLELTSASTAAAKLALIQARLLLQVYSVMYTSGQETTCGLQLHAKSVELSRKGGLMDPLPVKSNSTTDLDALWYEWIHAESHKSSLITLGPLISARACDGGQATWCEATWHMTMIELLNWSSAHTNGVVEGSVDAALASAWFLQYLDRADTAVVEPPWITVYAFKAFYIAWHLARAGNFDTMTHIGLIDMPGIMTWANVVFGRRGKWEVGKLILRSLDSLEIV